MAKTDPFSVYYARVPMDIAAEVNKGSEVTVKIALGSGLSTLEVSPANPPVNMGNRFFFTDPYDGLTDEEFSDHMQEILKENHETA